MGCSGSECRDNVGAGSDGNTKALETTSALAVSVLFSPCGAVQSGAAG